MLDKAVTGVTTPYSPLEWFRADCLPGEMQGGRLAVPHIFGGQDEQWLPTGHHDASSSFVSGQPGSSSNLSHQSPGPQFPAAGPATEAAQQSSPLPGLLAEWESPAVGGSWIAAAEAGSSDDDNDGHE